MPCLLSDANTGRLNSCRDELDELNERRDAQHRRRTERFFNRSSGDPSKLFEDRPCQGWEIASGNALDEEAHSFADQADEEIFDIEEKLDLVGPPEKGLFNEIWSTLKAYRRHLHAIDNEDSGDDDGFDA